MSMKGHMAKLWRDICLKTNHCTNHDPQILHYLLWTKNSLRVWKWHLNSCALIAKNIWLFAYIKILDKRFVIHTNSSWSSNVPPSQALQQRSPIGSCGPGPDPDIVLSKHRPITHKLLRIITFKYFSSLYSTGLVAHRNPQTNCLYIIPHDAT